MSSKGWRAQQKAEEGAGFSSSGGGTGGGGQDLGRVLLTFYTCETCGICIGPDHAEEDLYLYPVEGKQKVHWISKGEAQREYYTSFQHGWVSPLSGREYTLQGTWLMICGGCARHRSRNLPPEWCLLSSLHWHTTLLLLTSTTTDEGEQEGGWESGRGEVHPAPPFRALDETNADEVGAVYQACRDYIAMRLFFLFLLSLASSGHGALPLSLATTLFGQKTQKGKMGTGGREKKGRSGLLPLPVSPPPSPPLSHVVPPSPSPSPSPSSSFVSPYRMILQESA